MVRSSSLLVGIFLLLSPALMAQEVTVILFQPPPNQLRIADLWRVSLVNTTDEPIEIYLHGTVTERRDGLVVDAESRTFTLQPGPTQITGRELEPIKVNSSNDRYREIVTRTGSAPSGEYTICVYAIERATGAELGSDCLDHSVERFSPPVLISPVDETDLSEKLPVFTWTPPVPTPRTRGGLTYRLRVAEILGRQTPYDALQSNPPFFERRDIRTPVLQYPSTARSFVQGRRYAWGVSAYDNNVEIGKSEVWSFTATTVELALNAQLALNENLVATLLTMKGDGVVAGRGVSATLVESSSGSGSGGRFGAVGTLSAGGGAPSIDAQVWTWGNNEYGELGTGGVPATARSTPAAVTALDHVRKVALGAEHGLAINISGNVGAWGSNDFGQLGTGNDQAKNTPVWIPGLSGVIDVGAGNYHSVALKNDGTVWTWGYNRSGELGRGNDPEDDSPGKTSLSGIVAVAAGDGHSLALGSDGSVWGWGTNRYGQADPSSDADPIVTRPVKIEGLSGVKAIAAGGTFSLALLEDGTIRAWGSNNSGQLGSGAAEPGATLTNRLVLGTIKLGEGGHGGSGDRIRTLRTTGDTPPSTGGISLVKNLELGLVIVNLSGIVKVNGLTGVVAIDAGGAHSVALRSDSTVWSWGNNYWGALGTGDRDGRQGPARVNGVDRIVGIAAGGDHSMAAATDRTLYAWGNNASKQLGSASLPATVAPDGEEFSTDPITVPKP